MVVDALKQLEGTRVEGKSPQQGMIDLLKQLDRRLVAAMVFDESQKKQITKYQQEYHSPTLVAMHSSIYLSNCSYQFVV